METTGARKAPPPKRWGSRGGGWQAPQTSELLWTPDRTSLHQRPCDSISKQ